jgi:L-ascorbate metabolism protein UlaG (beta-lactamase superfamily)
MMKANAMMFRLFATLTLGTLGFLLALIVLAELFAVPRYRGPISPHFDGKRFTNLFPFEAPGFGKVLRWRLLTQHAEWPERVAFPEAKTVRARISDGAVITYVNHATVLVQIAGLNILTDPVFSERIGPISRFGTRRHKDPGIAFERMPKIDVILISHNHYDHLDIATLSRFAERDSPTVLTGLGNAALLDREGIAGGLELDLWESRRIGKITFTLTPTQHWSSRSLSDRFRALWGAFYLQSGKTRIYFGGDTGFGPHFAETARRLGAPDIALLPIGAYAPRWFMRAQHLDPADAVEAHLALGAKVSVGIHFGCFNLASEGMLEPVEELERARIARRLTRSSFVTLEHGEQLLWPDRDSI